MCVEDIATGSVICYGDEEDEDIYDDDDSSDSEADWSLYYDGEFETLYFYYNDNYYDDYDASEYGCVIQISTGDEYCNSMDPYVWYWTNINGFCSYEDNEETCDYYGESDLNDEDGFVCD